MPTRKGILLIGGSGFLGLALARALARAGREVHVLSRNTQPGKAEGISFHRGSQDDSDIVLPLLRACDTVVHLASTTTPGSSARKPVLDAEENLLPAIRLMEIISGAPPSRLVFVSSGGSIYGNAVQMPVDETAQTQPLSYHAAGKLALESLFGVFAHPNKVSLTIVRPSNLYGPGQRLRHGFGLIRTLLDRALHGKPIEVWGDGNALRDYIYIDDAVAACLSLFEPESPARTFNLGSGTGTSIREIIEMVEKVTGRQTPLLVRQARDTDVRAIILDSNRLQAATGWTPRVGLEEGTSSTWAWLRQADL